MTVCCASHTYALRVVHSQHKLLCKLAVAAWKRRLAEGPSAEQSGDTMYGTAAA
jgi:hypothetical protein